MTVEIYVEGGGKQNKYAETRCRSAFSKLFENYCETHSKPTFIACGDRANTFRDFCLALDNEPHIHCVLLVDSEEAVVTGGSAWVHLKNRKGDGWQKPPRAVNEQAHLMVQCMESWFLADRDFLIKYYGKGFLATSLPKNLDLEQVPKPKVNSALDHATKKTLKGKYRRVDHGFEILGQIDFAKVCEKFPHARDFRDHVLKKLSE